MMQVHLYCPDCMAEASKEYEKGKGGVAPILSDVYELLNDGVYPVHCPKGHSGKVVLANLHFELLFDLGINAIGDGYYRDAVASITASLERYYEFFVKTVWHAQGIAFEIIDKNWKEMSNQSERQLGAYIVSYSYSFGDVAPLMANSMTKFRNSVIHKGEFPTREKTIVYAGAVLTLIDESLLLLQAKYQEAVEATFEHYAPHYEPADENENVLTINHPTIIRANKPLPEDDQRKNRDINYLVDMVLKDRHPQRMWFINGEESKLVRENYEKWLSQRLQGQNDDVEHNELQVVINPDATAEECLNNLGAQIEENDSIWAYLGEEHPELFCSDTLTIHLANVQLQTHLYYLYLRVRLYQLLLNSNPKDERLKEEYAKAEGDLRDYHKGLSCFE